MPPVIGLAVKRTNSFVDVHVLFIERQAR